MARQILSTSSIYIGNLIFCLAHAEFHPRMSYSGNDSMDTATFGIVGCSEKGIESVDLSRGLVSNGRTIKKGGSIIEYQDLKAAYQEQGTCRHLALHPGHYMAFDQRLPPSIRNTRRPCLLPFFP